MIKRLIIILSMMLITFGIFANEQKSLIGWHWYNEPVKKQIKKRRDNTVIKAFDQLSPLQQLKILQMATNNLKAKAVLSGNTNDITAYKQAQDFWVHRATRFTVGWEQMLLQHPGLDYSLNFSHENALAPMMQRDQHTRETHAVIHLAERNGLLFFYRGKNNGDQLFSNTVRHYARRYHWVVIPVSVDGVLSPAFKKSRQTNGLQKARALGVRYFPSLVLVNPTTHQHEVVSYGFKSEDELSDRLLKIADGWQADF